MDHPNIARAMRTGCAPWQAEGPVGYCTRCGGEIYDGGESCAECRAAETAKERRWDQNTVQAIMEEMDYYLQRALADGPRNELWNILAEKFLIDGENEDRKEST